MNKREKTLAMSVGGLLVLVLAVVGVRTVNNSLKNKRATINTNNRTIDTKKREIEKYQDILTHLADWQERSLPTDRQLAISLYKAWLIKTITNAKLEDPKIDLQPIRRVGRHYHKLQLTVNVKGKLDAFVRFLFDFYQANHLQQMRNLQLSKVESSSKLELKMTIEALILNDSKQKKDLSKKPSTRLAKKSYDEYFKSIVVRNLFGRPNQPPTIANEGRTDLYLGDTARITIRAKDPDGSDMFDIKLTGEIPAGATISKKDGKTAVVTWAIPADYQPSDVPFHIEVTDDGLPSKSAQQTFSVKVGYPPFELRSISNAKIRAAQPVRFQARMTNSKSQVNAKFEIQGQTPEGATLDETTGSFEWTPDGDVRIGEFNFTILAKERVMPHRSVSRDFVVTIEPPPALVLDFNAKQSIITAIVRSEGKPQIWLMTKPTGVLQKLSTGQELTAGNFKATISRIDVSKRFVELRSGDYEVTIRLGQSLDDAVKKHSLRDLQAGGL